MPAYNTSPLINNANPIPPATADKNNGDLTTFLSFPFYFILIY